MHWGLGGASQEELFVKTVVTLHFTVWGAFDPEPGKTEKNLKKAKPLHR